MIIALDVGTSSARAAVYDADGHAVDHRFHRVPYEPATTPDGGVEHDPALLLDAVAACLDAVGARGLARVDAVGVATFWHGLLGFGGDGRPVTPVYMWADARSAREAARLREEVDEHALHARTGCHVHASYWPAKLRWLTRERPGEARRAARWGSFGEHLELSLFGEAATSVSMASGTGCYADGAGDWDGETLALAGIDRARVFALARDAAPQRTLRGPWRGRWPALERARWLAAVGDGAASNVGSGCVDGSRVALNVGTSAALRVVTGAPVVPPRGLWRYRVDARRAMLGGATSEGGNVHAWCREVLALPDDDALEAALATAAPDTHGLTVLPFLAGERAPGWRDDRRGVVAGLSLATTAIDIARAGMEAVALRLAAVYDLLRPHAAPDHVVVASGGTIARSRAWTRTIADALGRAISWSAEPEATSHGAALLALEAIGRPFDARTSLTETFEPDGERAARLREARARQWRLDDRV